MKTLYIIRGIPGSGKSTLAEIVHLGTGSLNIEADDYFVNTQGEYRFNPRHLWQAHERCIEWVKGCMKESREAICVSNTFTRQWEIEPYRLLCSNYGYQLFEIICNNHFENVHGVPKEHVAKMEARFELKKYSPNKVIRTW